MGQVAVSKEKRLRPRDLDLKCRDGSIHTSEGGRQEDACMKCATTGIRREQRQCNDIELMGQKGETLNGECVLA